MRISDHAIDRGLERLWPHETRRGVRKKIEALAKGVRFFLMPDQPRRGVRKFGFAGSIELVASNDTIITLYEKEDLMERKARALVDVKCQGWEYEHQDLMVDHIVKTYLSDDYEYQDNLRVARAWVPEEVRAYDLAQSQGCCGSYDTGLTTKDGRTLRIGFNHGH